MPLRPPYFKCILIVLYQFMLRLTNNKIKQYINRFVHLLKRRRIP